MARVFSASGSSPVDLNSRRQKWMHPHSKSKGSMQQMSRSRLVEQFIAEG
jgi:hypothetical protein